MTGLVQGLLGRLSGLFRRTGDHPPPVGPEIGPRGLDAPDDDETMLPTVIPAHPETRLARWDGASAPRGADVQDRGASLRDRGASVHAGWREFDQIETWAERLDLDVDGVILVIDYLSVAGSSSRRRVRLNALYARGFVLYFRAFCYERLEPRTFRLDRVQAVIDLDGVVHDPITFTREILQVPAAQVASQIALAANAPPRRPEAPGDRHRHHSHAPLRILVALARADHRMHPEELRLILDYVEARSQRAGITTGAADIAAVEAYVKRLYPDRAALARALTSFERDEPAHEIDLLLTTAAALIQVDGKVDPAETRLITDMRQQLHQQMN